MTDAPALPLSPSQRIETTIYTSGQIGIDHQRGSAPDDFDEQVELAITALERVLADQQATLADVVKTTVILTDAKDFGAMNAIYARRFGQAKPARTTLVCQLALPELRFEIEAIAVARNT
jgi:2-iminobutanoate/2-iminopropanoate deaminase